MKGLHHTQLHRIAEILRNGQPNTIAIAREYSPTTSAGFIKPRLLLLQAAGCLEGRDKGQGHALSAYGHKLLEQGPEAFRHPIPHVAATPREPELELLEPETPAAEGPGRPCRSPRLAGGLDA